MRELGQLRAVLSDVQDVREDIDIVDSVWINGSDAVKLLLCSGEV